MLLAIAMLMTIVPSAFASTNPEGVTLEQDDAEGQQEFTISHESDCTDIIYEPFVQSIIHDASKGIADLQEAILEKKEYTHTTKYTKTVSKIKTTILNFDCFGKTITLSLAIILSRLKRINNEECVMSHILHHYTIFILLLQY